MQFLLPTNNLAAPGSSALQQQLSGPIQSAPVISAPKIFPVVPPPMQGLKRALNFNADNGGCGCWRMLWPEQLLNIERLAIISGSTAMLADPRYYQGIKSVRIQRQATPLQREFVKFLRHLSDSGGKFKIIYEVDDIIFKDDIPDYNACKSAFLDPQVEATARDIISMCDEFTVTCEFMRDYYMSQTGFKNVRVVPNYAPRWWIDRFYSTQKLAERYERNRKRPRIGYFGSGTHIDARNATGLRDDFAHIVDAVIKTRKEFRWVFTGTLPVQLRPYVASGEIEYHKWTSLMDYPYAIDRADVSITIAPLQDNTFNRAKSNIKYLEAGAFGIPCVCQDLVTYKAAPLKFVTGDDLIAHLRKLTSDRQYYNKQSKLARAYAETMWLEDHLDEYVDLYDVRKDS